MMGWQWHQLDRLQVICTSLQTDNITTQFLQARCPSCRPTNSIKALNETLLSILLVTFCLSRRLRKMYCGHARLCVCLSVRGRTPTLLHGPGCNLGAW